MSLVTLGLAEDDQHLFEGSQFNASGQDVWSSRVCPRCGESEETLFHQMWACPCNSELEVVRLHLRPLAQAEHEESPCFWLRGIKP